MAEYICNRNRLGWKDCPKSWIRRGERFELNDVEMAKTLLEAGYISKAPKDNSEKPTSKPIPEVKEEVEEETEPEVEKPKPKGKPKGKPKSMAEVDKT